MARWRIGVLAAALATLLGAGAALGAEFSPAPWLEDLAQLRDGLTAGYANLEWQAGRGLDLPGDYARAEGRLKRARDAFAARRAIERFIDVMADGHLELDWPNPPAAGAAAADSPQPLCDRLGYADADDDDAVATRLPGYRPMGAPSVLHAGLVEVGGRRVGVLRIPLFSPHGYRALCDRVAAQEGLGAASPCGEACRDRFAHEADVAFVREMQAALTALKAAGAQVLLVDIAGNGGGNDSSLALARLVTARPTPAPRVGFLRTPAWVAELASRQADIRAGLAKTAGPEHAALQRLEAALTQAKAEAAKPCDRAPLWRGQPIACSAVVTGTLYAGGLVAEPLAGPHDRPWSETVSAASRFPPSPPLWRGPLIVLVDANSASSSELFAAMLQDRHAATILGAPTAGAGCGHMTDAQPLVLRHSGARLFMPDCVRLRADGGDEVAGVQPDVLVGFRPHDTAAERVDRVARALPQAVKRAAAAASQGPR